MDFLVGSSPAALRAGASDVPPAAEAPPEGRGDRSVVMGWQGVLARWAVALVWFYEGLWCKVWPGRDDQRAIVGDVPHMPAWAVTTALIVIGFAEAAIGLWALSGLWARAAAVVQTALVVVFNAGGLLFGLDHIAEPGRMLTQNLAFVALIWLVERTSPGVVVR
ncbi:DoxX-like family protein [Streptomyces sasae]|uniref:DoxX-like family protein n=1 Tax=Streptomyces sasae TaxID=1266772 RepID=UPI00292CCD14|nr:DoxX-like family protein [Streptomyces sasae]